MNAGRSSPLSASAGGVAPPEDAITVPLPSPSHQAPLLRIRQLPHQLVEAAVSPLLHETSWASVGKTRGARFTVSSAPGLPVLASPSPLMSVVRRRLQTGRLFRAKQTPLISGSCLCFNFPPPPNCLFRSAESQSPTQLPFPPRPSCHHHLMRRRKEHRQGRTAGDRKRTF